jgi:hypothetical protein
VNALVSELFDEYAAAYAHGDRPDVATYLDRAGAEREQLGRMIDGFLQATAPPPPTEAALAALRARLSAEPPLLALRKQQAVTRDAVVDALVREQGWAVEKREKVKAYYHQLESGLLDATHVAPAVLETIARFLRARVSDFEGFRAEPLNAGLVFRRARDEASVAASAPLSEPAGQDEIDTAFRSAR